MKERMIKGVIMAGMATSLCVLAVQAKNALDSPKPAPPAYRDVNSDGIEDKIVQKRVWVGTPPTLRAVTYEQVFYGVKDENGKVKFYSALDFRKYLDSRSREPQVDYGLSK